MQERRNITSTLELRPYDINPSMNVVIAVVDILITHYSGVTWASWHLHASTTWMFLEEAVRASNKENIKAPH